MGEIALTAITATETEETPAEDAAEGDPPQDETAAGDAPTETTPPPTKKPRNLA